MHPRRRYQGVDPEVLEACHVLSAAAFHFSTSGGSIASFKELMPTEDRSCSPHRPTFELGRGGGEGILQERQRPLTVDHVGILPFGVISQIT